LGDIGIEKGLGRLTVIHFELKKKRKYKKVRLCIAQICMFRLIEFEL